MDPVNEEIGDDLAVALLDKDEAQEDEHQGGIGDVTEAEIEVRGRADKFALGALKEDA